MEDRPIDQHRQRVQRFDLVNTEEERCRLEIEPADEDRQLDPRSLLPGRKQLEAPLDRRAERALAGRSLARAGEQGEPLVEPFLELRERQHIEPRGRELDRQGNPVEAATDASDRGEVAVPRAEVGSHQHRSVEEEPDRLGFISSCGTGQLEGLHREQRLARNADRRLARVQHLHLRTRLQQPRS